MDKNIKIGLIGYGYWGKILYKTLLKLGYKNVIICDTNGTGDITDYTQLKKQEMVELDPYEVSYVLVATPPSTHYSICRHLLEKDINVFCEKTLVMDVHEAYHLYEIAEKENTKLFTDWTFTYNYAIQRIKQEYDEGLLGSIESISMHRYNDNIVHIIDGTTCKWDLACHDVSIIQYLVGILPSKTDWIEYSKKSNKNDSAFGILSYNNFSATINVSWTYGDKFRECIFDFTDATVIWDDKTQKLTYKPKQNSHFWEETIDYSSETSPLENSINSFISNEISNINKNITLQTLKILK